MKKLISELGFMLRVVLAMLSVMAFLCALLPPVRLIFALQLMGLMAVVLSYVAPNFRARRRPVAALGMTLFLVVSAFNIWETAGRSVPVSTAPGDRATSFINSVIAEEDGIFVAARLLPLIGAATQREREGFAAALERNYVLMRAETGNFPTPLISTFLGLQRASSFDLIRFEPIGARRGTVLFLHGSMGNWSLLCWLISRAAAPSGFATVCPSVGPLGFWDSDRGNAVVAESIAGIRKLGPEPIILAGLSAGAVGAGAIAPKIEADISAVMLLFGVHPAVRDTRLPVLVIYAELDERFRRVIMEQLLAIMQSGTAQIESYRIAEADHFALVKVSDLVIRRMADWIAAVHGRTVSSGASLHSTQQPLR